MSHQELDRRLAEALHNDCEAISAGHDPERARRRAVAALATVTTNGATAGATGLGTWAVGSIVLAVVAIAIGGMFLIRSRAESVATVRTVNAVANSSSSPSTTQSIPAPLNADTALAGVKNTAPARTAPAVRPTPRQTRAATRKGAASSSPRPAPTVVQESSVEVRVRIDPNRK